MSEDDLRLRLRAAEASALRLVEAPGVQAVRQSLRRRRRNRAIVACLLVAAVISGSAAVLAAQVQDRVPPIHPTPPSVESTMNRSGTVSPTREAVAVPPANPSSRPPTQCTRNPIGVDVSDSTRIAVNALDITGRVMPICPGVSLRVMWASYQVNTVTRDGQLYRTGEVYLDSGRPEVSVSPQVPSGCSWWVVIASNNVRPPNTIDLFGFTPGTPRSPFWDHATGRDSQTRSSPGTICPPGTPTP